jgi:hypothetical protein
MHSRIANRVQVIEDVPDDLPTGGTDDALDILKDHPLGTTDTDNPNELQEQPVVGVL